MELFWPDGAPPKSRHSLSQALTAIRAAFRGDVIRRTAEAVQFTGEICTDLDLTDWHGIDAAHPLSEIDGCASADFAHWVEGVRQRCTRAARGRLIEAIEKARVAGDNRAVHERASTLYAVDPVSDVAAQALAETLLLEGDTTAAMRFLRNHLAHADEELGKIEHTEIKRLLRHLQNGGASTRPMSPASDVYQVSTRAEIFVGRETELRYLESLWCAIRQKQFKAALLGGPAGIGKSSLLRRFATTLTARAFPVLVVTCQEIGAGIPFAVVADLIRELARDPALVATDPMWLAEATRIYPALKATYAGIPEPPAAPAEVIRLRLAEALLHMVEAVSENGPILIGLDDIQHMDPASRDVLHLSARRWDSSPILVIGTWRTAGLQGHADAGGGPVHWDQVIDVGPLGNEQIASILSQAGTAGSVDEAIGREITALAQGNPYFAEMLVTDWRNHTSSSLAAATASGKAARWEPPRTMRLAFGRLFEGMTPETRDLLDVLAVSGRALSPRELGDLLHWEGSIDAAVVALMQRGIVRFEQGTFAFKNELHRAFVYYAMQDEARRYDHSRVARGMTTWAAADDFRTALEVSHHLVRAGMHDEAVQMVEPASEKAILQGAPREAEKALRSVMDAISTEGSSKLRLLLAQALEGQGRNRDALDVIDGFKPDQRAYLDAATAAILRARCLRLGRLASDAEIVAAAHAAVARARLSRNPSAAALALLVQVEVASDLGDPDTLRRATRSSERIGRSSSDPHARALSCLTRGFSLMVTGSFDAARNAFRESDRFFSDTLVGTERQRALNGIGICSSAVADLGGAVEAFDKAINLADRAGDIGYGTVLRCNLSTVHENFGFFESAMRTVSAALTLSEESKAPRAKAVAYARAAALTLAIGNHAQTQEFIHEAERAAADAGIPMFEAAVLVVKAEYHLSRDEHELAWPVIQLATELAKKNARAWSELAGVERLRRRWILATRGYEALREAEREGERQPRSIIDRLEIDAVSEWAMEQRGIAHNTVLHEMESRRLFGAIANLVTVGICLGGLKRSEGETSAQLVARLYPDSARGPVPSAVLLD